MRIDFDHNAPTAARVLITCDHTKHSDICERDVAEFWASGLAWLTQYEGHDFDISADGFNHWYSDGRGQYIQDGKRTSTPGPGTPMTLSLHCPDCDLTKRVSGGQLAPILKELAENQIERITLRMLIRLLS